jgi:superoxide dismutase, Cu-Zn family
MRTLLAIALLGASALLSAAAPPSASAVLKDAKGKPVGTVQLAMTLDGLSVRLVVRKFKAAKGSHAVHLHSIGSCAGAGFKASGADWNPLNKAHGRDNPKGPHAGDLPNMVIDKKGNGSLETIIPVGRLTGGSNALLDADGGAIILHAGQDDQSSNPDGKSGTGIACGVIDLTKP